MTFLIYSWICCAINVLYINAASIEEKISARTMSDNANNEDPLHQGSEYPFQNLACQSRLSFQIENCLQSFEARYILYSDESNNSAHQKAMEKLLCRDYEQGLQCLHFALQACPPTDFHLHMMEGRLGHVRYPMEDICSRSHGIQQISSTTHNPLSSSTTNKRESTTDIAQEESNSVPTYYDIKVLDKPENTALRPENQDSLNTVKGYKDLKDIPSKDTVQYEQLTKAVVKNVLTKDTFWNKILKIESYLIPEMEPQTLNCNDNENSNPLCQEMLFSAGVSYVYNYWTLLCLIILSYLLYQ